MGQYYKPLSLEKMEAVYSHDFGNGLKLMEHSWLTNDFVAVVENLISEGGRWFGDHIVWAGDYADPEFDLETGETIQHEYEGKMYDTNLYDLVSKNIIKPTDTKYNKFRYILNLDLLQFVDIKKVPVSDVYVDEKGKEWPYRIHPLPLLTCEGNNRGGGDYRGENPLIGLWARCRVVMSKTKPKGYEEIIFNLVE